MSPKGRLGRGALRLATPLAGRAVARGVTRVPGLRRLPAFKLLELANVALLAREHLAKLNPTERRRLVALVRSGSHGPRAFSASQRSELAKLIAKAEPRLFVGEAAKRLSPVPLPRRLVRGPRRKRKRR